jgi:serine/threonine protein kinase
VDGLPDYNKVSFPTLLPVDLRVIMPHASPSDVAFLLTLLCLDPMERNTAEQARDSLYFKELPLPCPLSELPVHNRQSSSVKKRLLKKNDDVAEYLEIFLNK